MHKKFQNNSVIVGVKEYMDNAANCIDDCYQCLTAKNIKTSAF